MLLSMGLLLLCFSLTHEAAKRIILLIRKFKPNANNSTFSKMLGINLFLYLLFPSTFYCKTEFV